MKITGLYFLFIVLVYLIFSCHASKPIMPGSDRDSHRCIPSAGYQWSEIKKECIRSFELPLQLYNVDSTFIAGILFSENKKYAEVFSKEGHFVLEQKNDSMYLGKSGVMLKSDNGRFYLKCYNEQYFK